MIDEYKPNSHKSKEEQAESLPAKRVEKVITGEVKSKKKSDLQKFVSVFISEDIGNVKDYIFTGVMVPAVKNAILDIAYMLLGGEGSRRNRISSKISYRDYYDRESDRRRNYSPAKAKGGYNYDEIILDSRGEGEDVLSRMDELISVYGLVSVADLYDLVGITGNYTDNNYGWTDIRSASVVRVRDGYQIKLPKVLPLN